MVEYISCSFNEINPVLCTHLLPLQSHGQL